MHAYVARRFLTVPKKEQLPDPILGDLNPVQILTTCFSIFFLNFNFLGFQTCLFQLGFQKKYFIHISRFA